MRNDDFNPESNTLPQGVDERGLLNAIELSGYPLQGIVAQKLSSEFIVVEEWGFVDRETKEHRALDLHAFKRIGSGSKNIHPGLILLMECKRSRHPYIFFKSVPNYPNPRFPKILSIAPDVNISIRGTNQVWMPSHSEFLGLGSLDFIEPGPPKCSSFAKAVPNGKKVNLSGTDPFNSLVLPLTKALDYAANIYQPVSKESLSPSLAFCISVLDAPMLLVDDPERPKEPIFTPWVRIIRQEANARGNSWERHRYYYVDAVHIDYLDEYIETKVLPFAETFGNRMIDVGEILLHGGEIDASENRDWTKVRAKPPSSR